MTQVWSRRLVSTESKVHNTLQKLMREYIKKDVDIQELDFQPHGWHKKEMVKHKGVIRWGVIWCLRVQCWRILLRLTGRLVVFILCFQ